MKFLGVARNTFNVKPLTSEQMESVMRRCANIYAGFPEWIDDKEHIKTINFAKALCSEVARLTTLDIDVTFTGSGRADYLQEQIEKVKSQIRKWVEYGAAYGSVILKPNGKTIDIVPPNHFTIVNEENGIITGIVFQETIRSSDGEHFYHRLEYHNRTNGRYTVQNRTYYSDAENDIGRELDIQSTPWNGLSEEVTIENAEGNLFGFLTMPHANNVDIDSPLGMPIISECIEELKDLDIAYSRNALEIIQSKRTVLLDSDKLMADGRKVSTASMDYKRKLMGLPDMVKAVEGDGTGNFYQEINPLIQTDARLVGINALLSQIGYKVGFANGYFVFNEQMGIQTATGVEANQQRTIQFIKDVRDKLEICLNELIYAINAFADAYTDIPAGEYETAFKFGDITYNVEEDRARWWSYVMAGKCPAWKFFVKFEGMTEEDAKAMVDEATPKEMNPFGGVE